MYSQSHLHILIYTCVLFSFDSQGVESDQDLQIPVPDIVKGDKVMKEFSGDPYRGTVIEIDNDLKGKPLFHIVYEDGDSEDLDLIECRKTVNLGHVNEWDFEKTQKRSSNPL